MACLSKSPSAQGRRLFELLEEQQEPFLLEVYLLENGYSNRVLKSQAASMCWPGGAFQRLQRLSSHGLKRRCGFLRCILTKVLYGKAAKKALDWDRKAPENGRSSFFDCFTEMERKNHDVEPGGSFSCPRGSGSARELDGDGQWKCMEVEEDLEQHSPVSVLELRSCEGSPAHSRNKEENKSTSSLDSTAEALDMIKELLEAACSPSFNQFAKSNKVLHQPEQLLLDCVREVEEKICASHESLSPEMTRKIINEEILSWEMQKGDLMRISNLIFSDVSNSMREWNRFRSQMREIVIEIEAAIFEEITEGFVLNLLDFPCTYEKF
ncbi:uncharacterized protein LOC120110972 [Phoenix dactylifera]|uniref:Uncharacterized protein LOC120110972 n=1 Tax=Phoenix dactylifera TaxID=42345 RepID=A0A8B9AI33_PHODC|nr:uncharacterized protein LOC120110972 [Phoenix dactylifera]